MSPEAVVESVRRLAAPFFAEGAERVFVARCCNRIFVGVRPADTCATCKQPVKNAECASLEAVVSSQTDNQ